MAARAAFSWLCLISILGFAGRLPNRPTVFLAYSNEAVLPFYVLHHAVIVYIGYLLVGWETSIGLKFPVLLLSSFAAIMLIYHVAIRPWPPMRFLFGLKRHESS